jgi:hypothetical protein
MNKNTNNTHGANPAVKTTMNPATGAPRASALRCTTALALTVTKTSPLWMLYPKTLAHDRKTAGANHKTNHLLANGKLPKKNGNTPGNVYIAKPWARDELPTYTSTLTIASTTRTILFN